MTLRKRYVSTTKGQVHLYQHEARDHSIQSRPPLICLHPAPSSGLFFKTIMPLLSTRRRTIAPDYPGYGGSYALCEPPHISDYAEALSESLENTHSEGQLDLLGFHTGCLVALEMARAFPRSRIGRVILIDVPYFTYEKRQQLLHSACKPLSLTENLSTLSPVWESYLTGKLNQMSLDRAFELLVESWRPGTRNHYAFHAAFSYDCETHFSSFELPVDVIATESGLRAPTLAAASALAQSTLHDYDDISSGVFDRYASVIAPRITALLDQSN